MENSSVIQYWKSGHHGNMEQTLQLAYHPVYARSYWALALDVFGLDVNVLQELTYIVGRANYDKALTSYLPLIQGWMISNKLQNASVL